MKLRFGVLCYSTRFAAWEADCLRRIMAAGAEPALLVIDPNVPAAATGVSSPLRKIKTLLRSKNAGWLIFERFFVDGRIKALEQVDLSDVFGRVPQLKCEVIRKGKFSEYFKPEDIARIREYNLDFMLRLAFGIIRGEILQTPRLGVWSFHHDDEERYRGGPPAFWEIYKGDPYSGVLLQRLTDRLDGGIVLKKDRFPTANYSYAENRDRGLFGAAGWPAEMCQKILGGEVELFEQPPSKSTAPIYYHPTNLQMTTFAPRILKNYLVHKLRPAKVRET